MKEYSFKSKVEWTGNMGSGTFDTRTYEKSHTISVPNKEQKIYASSSSFFRGDETKLNPQELFLSSISSCHLMWFLQFCADNEVIVLEYIDFPEGVIKEDSNGTGKFDKIILRPTIIVSEKSMIEKAILLHQEINKKCFVANSCNFPIICEPVIDFLK